MTDIPSQKTDYTEGDGGDGDGGEERVQRVVMAGSDDGSGGDSGEQKVVTGDGDNDDGDGVGGREEAGVVRARETGQAITNALTQHEHTLHALLKHGCTMVGNVEVAAVSGEVVAVVEGEARREAWREALQKDAQGTQDAIDRITQYWEEAIAHTIPEELHRSLCQLRDWSEELREDKVSVVAGLRAELSTLDVNYGTQLLQQARQRGELLRRITEHVTELHQAYRDSLTKVQDVVDEERAALVKYYQDVWEAAVMELNQQLHALLHERLHNRTSRLDQIIELKLQGAAEHTAVKDQLDADIEKVVVEVMRMKAAQQVEESQLRYSHQVLQQQLKETTEMVSEARRSLNSLTPTLNTYRRKAEAAEESRAGKEQAKTREAARLRQVRDQYRQRLAHTSTWYGQQARRLALMHYEAAHALIMQIVEVERGIQQGVLAREWIEPDLHALDDLRPAAHPRRTTALATAARILQQPPPIDPSMVEREGRSGGDGHESLSGGRSLDGGEMMDFWREMGVVGGGGGGGEDDDDDGGGMEVKFLTQLARETVFLLDTDTGHITESGPLLLLEHIFWELGVHTENDVERLLRQARRQVAKRQQPSRHRDGGEGEMAEGEAQGDVEEEEEEEEAREIENEDSGAEDSEDLFVEFTGRFTTEEVLSVLIDYCSGRTPTPSTHVVKTLYSGEDEPLYSQEGEEAQRWTTFLDHFCKRARAWTAAREALTQYRDVLTERSEEDATSGETTERERRAEVLVEGCCGGTLNIGAWLTLPKIVDPFPLTSLPSSNLVTL